MSQQINLYQPILRREKKVFSATTMLQILGAMLLLMLGLYGYNAWQVAALEQQLAQLHAQEREMIARVTAVSRELQTRTESRELRERVEDARLERDLKRRLVALLDRRDEGPLASQGFAEMFAALARQPVGGLWLTHVEVDQAETSRQLTLRGRAAQAQLVPLLVQRLGNETVFSGVRFQHMEVHAEDGGNTLAFELSTRVPEEEAR